jgi:predicted Holliday junction resolvase-like endonuclease
MMLCDIMGNIIIIIIIIIIVINIITTIIIIIIIIIELKGEIESIQRMLEKGRARMQADFDEWYNKV